MLRIDEIADKRAYETACVEALAAVLADKNDRAWMQRHGIHPGEIRLEGDHPVTTLVLTTTDERPGKPREREFRYGLWKGAAQLGQAEGLRPPPELMASNIFVWMMES